MARFAFSGPRDVGTPYDDWGTLMDETFTISDPGATEMDIMFTAMLVPSDGDKIAWESHFYINNEERPNVRIQEIARTTDNWGSHTMQQTYYMTIPYTSSINVFLNVRRFVSGGLWLKYFYLFIETR